MAIINKSSFAKALWPGVNSWYGEAYKEYPEEYVQLFEKDTSDRAFEEDVGVTGFGLASIKPDGTAVTYDSARQGFTTRYTHVTYGTGFIITEEMIEDDQYMMVAKKDSRALAFAIRQTKEILGANVYNRAFNTSYTGGDGSTLSASASGGSASHANVTGGTWTNGPATAADLSEAALEQAVIDIMGFTNDRGLKIAVLPESLIIPKELIFEAERILKSPFRPASANNDVNAIERTGYFKNLEVNHYLTSTTAWFIRTNVPDGMKYFERRADTFSEDNDFDTNNIKYKATFRCSFGWTDPRGMYACVGV